MNVIGSVNEKAESPSFRKTIAMSRGSQIIIGAVSGLLGIMVFAVAMQSPPDQKPDPKILLFLSAIAMCVSIACFIRKSRPVTLRLIGIVLVSAGIGVFFIGPPDQNSNKKQIQSYVFFAALAAGGGWLAVTGKYPQWGAFGIAMAEIEKANSKKKTSGDLKGKRAKKRRRPDEPI
jgi:hypothetical protein